MDDREDMPIGLAFGLSMNERAMESFAKLTDKEKLQVLEAARSVDTREKMHGIIEDITRLG